MTDFTKDPSTHPANGPLTEERLIRVRDELAAAAKRSDGGNLGYMMADAAKAIDEVLALRKVEQEPVAYMHKAQGDVYRPEWLTDEAINGDNYAPLYAAPQLPQPAVAEPVTWISRNKKTGEVELAEPHEVATNPEYWTDAFPAYGTHMSAQLPPEMSPEMMRAVQLNSELGAYATANLSGAYDLFAEFWQVAYRAAMLQAEPVSNSDELPLDYLQGHKDGLEWAAQLAEANHPQTGDWLYDDPIDLARAIRKGPDMPTVQAGNSPVTPDGWISCSDRMPEDTKMLLAFSQGEIVAAYWNWVVNPIDYKKYRAFTYLSGNILDDVTHWMPLPEPPQEVK